MSTHEPKHVYDWLDEPALSPAEADAKEWLNNFCKGAAYKDHDWLDHYKVTCEYKVKRFHVSGASRMGDVWLREKDSKSFYDHRVLVEECTNWKRITRATQPPTGGQS